MAISTKCPTCAELITFPAEATGNALACPRCNQTLLTLAEDPSAAIAEPQHDVRMKLAIVACGAGVGMFVVALFAVVMLSLRTPHAEQTVRLPQPIAATPAVSPSQTKRPVAKQRTGTGVESPTVPVPQSAWKDIEEIGRRSKSWLYVNLTPRSDGSRTVRIRDTGNEFQFPERTLADGEGVPLFECSSLMLNYRGWANAATKPESETDRHLLQSERETELYRICKLSDFGTGSFDRGDDDQQSFDHRHVWSPDGNYLYVLAGLGRGSRKQRLSKINTRTWDIELELRPNEDVSDIAWTSQGLVVVADPLMLGTEKYSDGDTWVRLIPSNQQLQNYKGGIFLLDADTLSVRKGWVTPRVQEVAGHAGSDLIYLRSPQDALLVVNVKTGELMSCYSYHDLLGDAWEDPVRDDLHFLHPRLSTDGHSLTTHGMNNVVTDSRRSGVADNSLGPRSVNRFRLAGSVVEWEQSRRAGGVRSRFTRLSDVGIGDDYLCLPDQRFEIVSANEIRTPLAKLSLPPETAVVVDSPSKTIFLCWPDWPARQLTFRMIRNNADTELTLADGIQPNDAPTKFSQSRFAEKLLVHHNLWPFEMSAAPHGRGAIVFTPTAAYWIEPKFGPGTEWAFNGSPSEATVAQSDERDVLARRRAEALTRCKAATALILVPAKDEFGSAFCIDEQGHFLTSAYHVKELAVGSQVSLVIQAGSFYERPATATIMRIEPTVGIALLKTSPHPDLVPLQLGHDELLTEAAALTAFGYTRVPDTETSAGRYPCVGVKPGVATALRKSEGELVAIQFNGVLLPGNSGGPVVNAAGEVVGIALSGIELLGLNFLVPATQLKRLDWPELEQASQIAQDRPSMKDRTLTELAKDATALVVLPDRKGFGTAFCVDKRGYFATNAHVVEGLAATKVVNLVLHSGESRQRLANAKVVRVIKESDLALLQLVDQDDELTVLELDHSTILAEQMEVTAFGFPFGDALAVSGQQFPSVSVNVASIEATKTSTLGHDAFEFHTQLNPGNSGGPVINAAGKVVGVVFATKLGARKSFAIPVARLRDLMFSPDIAWKVLAVDYPERRRETTFPVTVTPYLRSLDGLELSLSLQPEYGPEKTYPITAIASQGNYELRVPLIATDVPDYLKATFDFNTASISGIVADQEVKIGAATYRLSTAPEGAFLGDQIVSGLESLSIGIGKAKYLIDGSRAIGATIKPFRTSYVTYTVVARQDDREVARVSGSIDVSIRESSELRSHRFEKRLVEAWSEGALARDLPPLQVTATFGDGTISGLATNRRFQVIGQPTPEEYDLSEVNWIRIPAQPKYDAAGDVIKSYTLDLTGVGRMLNRSANGSQLVGLEQVPLRVGQSEILVDLTAAEQVVVKPLREPSTNKLPLHTPIADLAAGGRGSWLILHLPQYERLAVVDVITRRIVHHVPLADSNVLFAASAEKLLVVFPALKAIERWDLKSGRHELTAEFSQDGIIGAVAMGCGGVGPLLMHGYDSSDPPVARWTLVDLQSLTLSALEARLPESSYPKSPPLASSVDGTVFGSLDLALILKGTSADTVEIKAEFSPVTVQPYPTFLVSPGASGRQLFYRNSIYSQQGEVLGGDVKFSLGVPTYHDEYSLSFFYSTTSSKRQPQVAICENKAAKLRRLIVFDTFAFDAFVNPKDDKLPLRKRYHLDPGSRTLVTIPLSDDVLLINDLPAWK